MSPQLNDAVDVLPQKEKLNCILLSMPKFYENNDCSQNNEKVDIRFVENRFLGKEKKTFAEDQDFALLWLWQKGHKRLQ